MKQKTCLLVLSVALIAVGCTNNNESNNGKGVPVQKMTTIEPNVIKVWVEQDGMITANGSSISLEDLDSSLSKLKNTNGSVYYSRANGQGEPPAEAMKVIDLVVKYGLPIKLYTDKTFTEIVKPD